tara:strand:+ start:9195 stop:10160 length:966 start_codon:yes stop_codon:yes gene_type:complete
MIKLLKSKYLKLIAWSVIGIFFLISISDLLYNDEISFNKIVNLVDFDLLIVGILTYLVSHLVRVFRLIIISNDFEYSFKDLMIEQYKANSINLIFPFKLGESYRIIAFKKFFKNYYNSFNLLLVERFFDFIMLILILGTALIISDVDIISIKNIFYIAVPIFILFTLFFYVFPDLMLIIHKIFIKKKLNKVNSFIINTSGKFYKSYNDIRKIVYNKIIIISILSFVIWSLELSVLFILFNSLNIPFDILVLLGVSIALSGLLPNGPLGLGGIQLAFFTISQFTDLMQEPILNSYLYSSFIFGSGIILGFILFIRSIIIKKY